MIVFLNGFCLALFKWSTAVADDAAATLAFLIITGKLLGQHLL